MAPADDVQTGFVVLSHAAIEKDGLGPAYRRRRFAADDAHDAIWPNPIFGGTAAADMSIGSLLADCMRGVRGRRQLKLRRIGMKGNLALRLRREHATGMGDSNSFDLRFSYSPATTDGVVATPKP